MSRDEREAGGGGGMARPVPILIPPSSPRRYVSFNLALNIREEGEDTGDWHEPVAFFRDAGTSDADRTVELAGEGYPVDTTPVLADRGVRDVTHILLEKGVIGPDDPAVFASNHLRAIADLAYDDARRGRGPGVATPETINGWLDTEAQVAELRSDYLAPLLDGLEGEARDRFIAFLARVEYA